MWIIVSVAMADWEPHKETMRRLFFVENKTYKDIMNEMSKHNFNKRYVTLQEFLARY